MFIIGILLTVVSVNAQIELPALDTLTPAEWTQITVPGAVCSRGTPYSFFVRPGDSTKLAVGFEGGGACWNAETCAIGGTFRDNISPAGLDGVGGAFNFDHAENPLSDWSVVLVSYCTGDVHVGEASVTYADGLTINHTGAVNTRAVLDWTFANFPEVDRLLIAGSSAGAYGAVFHAPTILTQYDDAQAFVFADAGLGVLPPDWDGLTTWNMTANLFDHPTYDDLDLTIFNNELIATSAALFPDVRFAQYSSARDGVQIGFYELMDAEAAEWSARAPELLDALEVLPNVNSYVAWGGTHTIMPTQLFYTMQTNGVRFLDWFTANLNGEPVDSVRCEDCSRTELFGGG